MKLTILTQFFFITLLTSYAVAEDKILVGADICFHPNGQTYQDHYNACAVGYHTLHWRELTQQYELEQTRRDLQFAQELIWEMQAIIEAQTRLQLNECFRYPFKVKNCRGLLIYNQYTR